MKRLLTLLFAVLIAVASVTVANAHPHAKKSAVKHSHSTAKAAPLYAAASTPLVEEPVLASSAETSVTPVAETPPKTDDEIVGYDGGFFIRNSDKSFVLMINGRMQPQAYFQKTTGSDSTWTFGIRRARLDFDATMWTNTSFHVTLNHSTKSAAFSTVNVFNLAVAHVFAPEFSVSVGQVGLPLDILQSRTSNGYQLPEAPNIISQIDGSAAQSTPLRSSFGAPSGIGVSLEGKFFKKLYYRLSAVNGAAQATNTVTGGVVSNPSGGEESDYTLNFDKKVSVGARLAYDIFENTGSFENDMPYSEKAKWIVSMGGIYQGKRQDPNFAVMPTINYLVTGSVGSSFKYRGFAVTAEAYARKTKIGNPGSATFYSNTLDDAAYYVDGGYFVIPNKLEIAARGSQLFREGPTNNSYEIDGSINWFPRGTPNLKLMAAYTMQKFYVNQTNAPTARNQAFTLFLATFF
ncbi:MAG: hypothetical protein COV46_00980 [Deltaproteobacteria bacterium CG11_big_fil_rev_8_21_14_0_20_49_13]|nr:MAG: hypothetical protein COV46_00980 [Deltaproteobacteria bacterium CG11_big_fil_rev_8_21_14_0_20_49_13]